MALYVYHRPHHRLVNNFTNVWLDGGFFVIHTIIMAYAFHDDGRFELDVEQREELGWYFIWLCQAILIVKVLVLLQE